MTTKAPVRLLQARRDVTAARAVWDAFCDQAREHGFTEAEHVAAANAWDAAVAALQLSAHTYRRHMWDDNRGCVHCEQEKLDYFYAYHPAD